MSSAKPRKITATADNGETLSRRTARTYSHAIYIECTYSDGTVENCEPSWAGRPDLMQKVLFDFRKSAAAQQGSEVCHWDRETRHYVGTGIIRQKVRAVAVPVNA